MVNCRPGGSTSTKRSCTPDVLRGDNAANQLDGSLGSDQMAGGLGNGHGFQPWGRGHLTARLRVSTDRQTVENQSKALEAIAAHRGWEVVTTYSDKGISGSKGRKDRPEFDRMLSDAGRGKFDVVMAFALDRIGRSLVDLLHTIRHLEGCKVDLFIDKQMLDTTAPQGKLHSP